MSKDETVIEHESLVFKASKKNYQLAKRIIEQKGNVSKDAGPSFTTWYADLELVIGMAFGSTQEKKADAIHDMANQLGSQLDEGNLVLSDTWDEDNLE